MDIEKAFTDIENYIKTEEKKEITQFSFEILKAVMMLTPVDTGRARAGWRYEDLSDNQKRIYNQVEYIIFLEFGHSRQAPLGMVRIAIENALRNLR